MRYEVRAGSQSVRVETSPDGRMLVNDRVIAYDVHELVAGRHWSVVVEGTAHEVALLGASQADGTMRMLVDGLELAMSAVDERALAARRDRAIVPGGRHEVRAPMPGLLKAIHVGEGEVVERDAALATLEAMKMENELRAPVRGTVRRVAASAGSKVESGALIVVLADDQA
jgi:3-methylcrotonyl-CoA carboxylase alpha subunit